MTPRTLSDRSGTRIPGPFRGPSSMFNRLLRPGMLGTAITAIALAVAPASAQDDGVRPAPAPLGPQFRPTSLPPPPSVPASDDTTEDGESASPATTGRSATTSASRAQGGADSSIDGIAQEDGEEGEDVGGEASSTIPGPTPPKQRPPEIEGAKTINIDFVDTPLSDVVKYFAQVTGRNFILTDDLKGEVTIISHQPVPVRTAYEAFISALEVHGYTTVTVGGMTKIVQTASAANTPVPIYESGIIPYDTDNFVTQIIQLDNVSVGDVSSVVKDLAGKGAKIIAYAPTNTLILTDAAVNIRRVYRIISQLDVASPKAKMEIIPLSYATAAEIERVIEELYGTEESSSSGSASRGTDAGKGRNRRGKNATPTAPEASASKVGAEGKYIEKIISDERTNSLIVMANDEAMEAVKKLIAQLDVDVDPSSRAQIHVVYLEHSKAEDVSQVLSNLASGGSSKNNTSNARNSRNARQSTQGAQPTPGGQRGAFGGNTEGGTGEGGSAVAAFDEGVRITSDESTNSLVLIATRDQFQIISQVIERLDIPRKQVFVEAVILEMATDDQNSVGLSFHGANPNASGGANIYSAQVGGTNSIPDQSLLSGMAVGVFGPSVPVSLGVGGEDGAATTLNIPAFGIVLNALQANSAVNIVSTPNILTMDNEEAKIVVGRNVPFPVGQTQTSFGVPLINFQREDVAITLKVTPQINESDYVTLETFLEIQEIEGDIAGTAASGGPTTSKRSVENTIVVKDNQTIVVGGLISETENETETKIPVLGDIPLIGALFRGKTKQSRKTNLMIFLTPHIIDEPADLEEIYRVKWAQRQEFIRRFYGRSREDQEAEMARLMSFSFNQIDQPSRYRGPTASSGKYQVVGEQAPMSTVNTGAPPAPTEPEPSGGLDEALPEERP